MIHLVLVGLLGLSQFSNPAAPFQAGTVEFETHDGKKVSHNNKVIYTKAPTAWVKLINN